MLTTNNDAWAGEVRLKSLHGISKNAWKRYQAEEFRPYEALYPGYRCNMMDIQAALGIHQLARVEENLRVRERYWHMYQDAFAEVPEVITPWEPLPRGSRHARHLYTILLDIEHLSISRNQFVQAMRAENIGTGIHFTALHLHRYYQKAFGYKVGDFPKAEWVGERTISLPLSPGLSEQDIRDVIAATCKVVSNYRCKG